MVGSHLSGTDIAARLKPPVRRLAEQAVAPELVLLRIEFTGWACYQVHRWALTPPFHPYPINGAVYFCCTCPAVARGRCYRLSCSVKPGLSSQGRPCAAARPTAVSFYQRREKMSRQLLAGEERAVFLKKFFIIKSEKKDIILQQGVV